MEEVQGLVSDTLFCNEENGYTVLQLRTEQKLCTVVGILPKLAEGEKVLFKGEWMEHPQYGKQFKAQACAIEKPTSLLAIERYLGSGLIKGVGPSTARAIVECFGTETLNVLGASPERLTEVPKIGETRMRQIAKSFVEQQNSRNTMLFLQSYGLPMGLSNKISKTYKDQAVRILKENPYQMVQDIDGVGFLTADRIAASMGISKDSEFRLQTGILYVLKEASSSGGHCYLPTELLIANSEKILEVSREAIELQLSQLIGNMQLMTLNLDGVETASLPSVMRCERDIAHHLLRLSSKVQQMIPQQVLRSIREFEKRNKISFSQTQVEAIVKASKENLIVITGGPGTGKTTLINCILEVLGDESVSLLAAPTGRAAKRMSEASGREARTLHRLLQFSGEEGRFSINEHNPLDCDCLVIDEMSMVDVFLMRSTLEAVKPGTRLILVGDAEQLPSVGAGNVLSDILESGIICSVRLTEIFRQEEQSLIVRNAHSINQGKTPRYNEKGSDFFLIRCQQAERAAKEIISLCLERLPRFLESRQGPAQLIQVLSPTKKGVCGVVTLNGLLQAALNPPSNSKKEIQFGETLFREGDKVIHVKNDYQLTWTDLNGTEGQGVFNGDVGYIIKIDEKGRELNVLYDDDREVVYEYTDLEELELAYCLSVHKSQGSEFPAVILPMVGGPRMLLTRNLLYTAVTRARSLVVLVGTENVVNQMIENNQERKRYTLLKHWLVMLDREFGR